LLRSSTCPSLKREKIIKEWHNVKNGDVIVRTTLRTLLPTVGDIISNLTKPVTINEPHFKELIAIYREVDKENDRGDIHIMSFNEIPMADVKAVFPKTNMTVRHSDQVWIYSYLVIGLIMTITSLFADTSFTQLLLVLSLVGIKLYQTYTYTEISKTESLAKVTKTLYDCAKGNSSIVIRDSFHSYEQQEVKETLIAFHVLQQHPNGLTEEQIKFHSEALLHELSVYTEFEVEDAIRKLVDMRLVTTSGDVYHAKEIAEATEDLQAKWRSKFEK